MPAVFKDQILKEDGYNQTPTIVRVLLMGKYPQLFDYAVPPDMTLELGDYVIVPLRKSTEIGVVWQLNSDTDYHGPVKVVLQRLPLPPLSANSRRFVEWVASYTLSHPGMVLRMAIGALNQFSERQLQQLASTPFTPFTTPSTAVGVTISLNQEQQTVATAIQQCLEERSHQFTPMLLEGITGSGKTEVYFQLIADCLSRGLQALILLPEIALNPQLLQRFSQRFGFTPHAWHSDLTPKVRRENWLAIASGEAQVVVGARSALFLPYPRLGLIIVDEEHDPSYKQEEGVMYHGRDMAVIRAKMENIPLLLASATPSLESRNNVQQGRYHYWQLTQRYGKSQLPEVILIPMQQRKPTDLLSPQLITAVATALANDEQALLFVNRRGYAPLMRCHHCGEYVNCEQCSSGLVWHRLLNVLLCHHCSTSYPVVTKCPHCQHADDIHPYGIGVERVAEVATDIFPNAKIELLSSDLLNHPKELQASLDRIHKREVNLLIGTQIIAKGHNFPDLTCVGIIDADMGNASGDFRITERNMQLITQVAGRAGRAERPGKVYVQTTTADSPVMQALVKHDFNAVAQLDTTMRQQWCWPPFSRLAAIIISSAEFELAKQAAQSLAHHLHQSRTSWEILGPIPAPIALLRGQHRWRLLLKAGKDCNLQQLIYDKILNSTLAKHPKLKLQVDVDPYNFM